MRVARSRWSSVVIASLAWSSVLPGGVLARDTGIPFRRACELATAGSVSTILGVAVTQRASTPDSYCSYLSGTEEAATVRLDPAPTFLLSRLGLGGAADETVGGRPAVSSTRGTLGTASADIVVGLEDGGTLQVQVSSDVDVTSPLAAARSLTEAILAAGPVTAHASGSTAAPVGYAGDECELVTRAELKRLTGQRFTEVNPPAPGSGFCRYRTKDRRTSVSVGIGTMELIVLRSDATTAMTIAGHEAVLVPDLPLLAVDLGGGRSLGIRFNGTWKDLTAEELPQLMESIAETAMGRMHPDPITCRLIGTDVVAGATGLALQPMATNGDWCWFTTPDEQTALLLKINDQRLLATPSLRDLPRTTDLEVAGYRAAAVSGPTETVLSVDLRRTRGKDREFLDLALIGVHPSITDPLATLESIAVELLDGL